MSHFYQFSKPAPNMPKRETEMLVSILKDIRQTATMKNANFPDEIKERTRIWRESWIISPLDDLIERYEHALDAK